MRWSRLSFSGLLLASLAAQADYMDHFVVREDVGLRKAPYLGKAELLVLPVEVAGFPRFDRPRLERFFSPEEPSGFVKFYEVSSLGRYQPHVTVAPTIGFAECPLPKDAFPDCAIRRGDFTAFQPGLEMIREVVRRARDSGVDFSKVDVNGRPPAPTTCLRLLAHLFAAPRASGRHDTAVYSLFTPHAARPTPTMSRNLYVGGVGGAGRGRRKDTRPSHLYPRCHAL